jgi:hypothetical protein
MQPIPVPVRAYLRRSLAGTVGAVLIFGIIAASFAFDRTTVRAGLGAVAGYVAISVAIGVFRFRSLLFDRGRRPPAA